MLGVLFVFASPAEAALKVVTTTQDLASLVELVGGDEVSVTWIARGDLDPHFIDAKPSFMVKLAAADLVVSVGMDLEIGWLPSLVTGARNPRIQQGTPGWLDASTTIHRIEVPTGSMDRSRGDLHPLGNPHYWMDPENGRAVARAIAGRLSELDPDHAATFSANLATFEQQLTAKEAEWSGKMAAVRGTPVIGYHSTFDYFLDAHGLQLLGFVEPKPGIPPTPSHTLELAQQGKAAGVKLILVEPYHDPTDANPIANATGAKVLALPSSVGAEASIHSWFDLMDALVRDVSGT